MSEKNKAIDQDNKPLMIIFTLFHPFPRTIPDHSLKNNSTPSTVFRYFYPLKNHVSMPQQNAQKEYLRREYTGRINRVMDYIEQHITDDLNLETLAAVASFSPFHFHRLFAAMTGETLNSFIRRTRLERGASMLMDAKRLDTITEIALQSGFSSNAVFTRAFREYFGMSPTEFRNGGYKKLGKMRKLHRKIGQDQRKNDKARRDGTAYFCDDNVKHQIIEIMKVEVKDIPAMHVAYVRHTGNYSKVGEAFGRLMQWAGPRGLLGKPDTKVLAVYHDDPGVTEEARLRTSVCVTIPDGMKTGGEVSNLDVEGGKYACGHFEITDKEFQGAWDAMMGKWHPESGYVCDDKPPFELYHNDHTTHPENKHIVDICIPVRPM